MDSEFDVLLKAPDVARILGVDTRTVWRWASSGVIPPPLRIGAVRASESGGSLKRSCATRWRRVDIEGFLKGKAEEAVREAEGAPSLPLSTRAANTVLDAAHAAPELGKTA